MIASLSLLFVEFWLLLPINVHGQYVGTLSLHSSLERSNRKFACPLESVAFTCSINGTVIRWDVQDGDELVQVGNFRHLVDRPGEGFSTPVQFNCYGKIIFSGVLERISNTSDSTQVCNSSMIMTPKSWNVSSDCDPLTIICKTLDPGAEANTLNITYQVAGKPTAPRNSTCVYYEYLDLISVVVNVTDIMLKNNKETEISYVSIVVTNTRDLEQLYNYSINSITEVDILNATFSYLNHEVDDHVRAYITTVDKCYQESLSETINCMTLGAKDKGQSRSNTSIICITVPVSVFIALLLIVIGVLLAIIIIKYRRNLCQCFQQCRNSSTHTSNPLVNDDAFS